LEVCIKQIIFYCRPKTLKSAETQSLESLAETALQQIDGKQYTAEFAARGIAHTLKISIAFQGKSFALRYVKDV